MSVFALTLKLCLLLKLTLSRTVVSTRPSKVLTLSLMMKFRFESTVMLAVDPFAVVAIPVSRETQYCRNSRD
jgi:hypothetical protein